MRKFAGLLTAAFTLFAAAASAQSTVLTAIDTSAPDTTCDVYNGVNPPTYRNCYIPAYGPNPTTPSDWGQAHKNAAFSITANFAVATVVQIDYLQITFLNTTGGLSPMYSISVGVDSTSIPCGMQPGNNLDLPGAAGLELHAVCITTVQPGMHTFYPLERARNGAFSYRGIPNQLLIVRY